MADIAPYVPAANYGIQAVNPTAAILQGVQGGFGIQEGQNQIAAQDLALQHQAQMQQDLNAFASKPNPGASDYAQMMERYPQLADKFKSSYDIMNTAQQQAQFQKLSPVFAALTNGKPDIAQQILDTQIEGYNNSGNAQGVAGATAMKQLIALHPQSAATSIGLQLYGADKDKFSDVLTALSGAKKTAALLPSEVATAEAGATSAGVKAGIDVATAPDVAAKPGLDNQKTEQDIAASKLAGDIAQKNVEIAQANSETERGKLTLERDKLVQQQAQLKQTQGLATQDSMDAASQALDTIQQIKTHPGMQDNLLQKVLLGSASTVPGTLWGKIYGKMPGSDRQALDSWVDSLKGQLGFQNLMAAKAANPNGASGFGSLSEGEMKLLSGLAGNLDTNSADFPKVLAQVEKILNRTQAKIVSNPNLPTAGGAVIATSPKYGVITQGRINALLQQIPGATRADVLKFLGVQ